MNAAYTKSISLPADLTAGAFGRGRANFAAMGIVSFSQDGIKYLPASRLMLKINIQMRLMNKRIWKYQVGQPIKYDDIVDVKLFKNNCLELVTARVNGSYYLSVPYSQSDSLPDISAFIQRCRDEGFDRAVQDQILFEKVEFHCAKAQKAMIVPTIIMMLASLAIAWYLNIFIGFALAFYAPVLAKQSGNRILYALSLVVLVVIIMLMIALMVLTA